VKKYEKKNPHLEEENRLSTSWNKLAFVCLLHDPLTTTFAGKLLPSASNLYIFLVTMVMCTAQLGKFGCGFEGPPSDYRALWEMTLQAYHHVWPVWTGFHLTGSIITSKAPLYFLIHEEGTRTLTNKRIRLNTFAEPSLGSWTFRIICAGHIYVG